MTDALVAPPRPKRWWMVGALLVILGAVLVVYSLAEWRDPDVDPAPSPGAVGATAGGVGEGWAPEARGRRALHGFGEVAVTVTASDGTTCEVCLLAATSSEQHQRGLMEVTDDNLGGYDGMLFEFPGEGSGAFWMRNTPMPLSIAYFDAARSLVSTADMVPCSDTSDCPGYPPDGPFQYALEVPRGRLPDVGVVGENTSFRITARTCPAANGR